MNCPDHETLSAFFDGEAPDARDHVVTCGECRAFLDDLTTIHEAVVATRPALGASSPTPDPRLPTPRPHRLPILAFALLLLVLLAVPTLLLLRPRNRDDGVFSKYDSGGRAVIYLRGRE